MPTKVTQRVDLITRTVLGSAEPAVRINAGREVHWISMRQFKRVDPRGLKIETSGIRRPQGVEIMSGVRAVIDLDSTVNPLRERLEGLVARATGKGNAMPAPVSNRQQFTGRVISGNDLRTGYMGAMSVLARV